MFPHFDRRHRLLIPLRMMLRLVGAVLFGGLSAFSHAYVLEGVQWPAGSVVHFAMGLGSSTRTLSDGNTSWDAAAMPGLSAWNLVVGQLHYTGDILPTSPVSGDGVNSVAFSSTIFGSSFGSNTLAVTVYLSNSQGLTEADVLFNSNQPFDSYRGPLRFGNNGFAIGDIRRIFTHELGHALGLDHPDQHGQHVVAIMNSVTSDQETLATDDIGGAQTLYSAPSPPPTPTPGITPTPTPGSSRLANISTRLNVGLGNNVMIAGFIVRGSRSKTVVVRGLGPTLSTLHVANSLHDPVLELHNATGATIAQSDDWETGSQAAQLRASGYAPANGIEAALLATLAPGSYTAIIKGYSNTTGVALAEVYDYDNSASTRLGNISTRGLVGTGDGVMIGGLIVKGSKRVVLRAIGPSLANPPFNLADALADPTLELRNASGTLLASNNDWIVGSQVTALANSGFAPANTAESALLLTLVSGNYTAIIRGNSNSTGIALFDAYDLDP